MLVRICTLESGGSGTCLAQTGAHARRAAGSAMRRLPRTKREWKEQCLTAVCGFGRGITAHRHDGLWPATVANRGTLVNDQRWGRREAALGGWSASLTQSLHQGSNVSRRCYIQESRRSPYGVPISEARFEDGCSVRCTEPPNSASRAIDRSCMSPLGLRRLDGI